MHRSQGHVVGWSKFACALAPLLVACGGAADQPIGSSQDGGSAGANNGSINAEFRLPSGSASSASYSLVGPNGFARTDVLHFDGSQAIGFLIDNVPPGDGYSLTLAADNGDAGEACTGSTSVNVASQQMVNVDVTAQCTGAPYVPAGFGSVDVWAALPASVTFVQASFVLTGPAGLEAQNMAAVSGKGLHFTLNDVPAGAGQILTLNTTSTDGSVTCSASSQFDVVANKTAEQMLKPQCQNNPGVGSH